MRIAVIDDEKYSRVELIHQILQTVPQAEIREAGNGVQALELIEKETFDILFIDIHLGDLEGTTVAALARRLMPKAAIVFATAYSDYAIRAFELRADDYILKPFDPARIRGILEERLADEAGESSRAACANRIAVRSNRRTTLLDPADVTFVETDGTGRGCIVHTLSGKAYPDGAPMSEYEARLAQHGFFRIHKTCLVQLRYIQDIFPWNNGGFALRMRGSQTALPIGRDRVKGLRQALEI